MRRKRRVAKKDEEVIEVMEEVYPIPEALTQSAWEIVGGETPKAMLNGGKLIVPLSPDQHDQVLRTHELAHIKWSPKEIPKDLNPGILAMVEDARITKKMLAAKVNLEPGYPEELVAYTVAKLRATRDKWGAVMFRIGMSGMPGQALVDKALGKEVGIGPTEYHLINQLRSDLTVTAGATWTFEWTKRLMNAIADERQEKEEEKQKGQSAARRGAAEKDAAEAFSRVARRQAEQDCEDVEGHAKTYEDLRPYTPDGIPRPRWWESSGRHVPWGGMIIEQPPLTQRMPGRFGRQRRPMDTGAALTYPSRLWQDQKVFGRKLKGRGGSVLIDASGSMSLTARQIWEILENAPGATIAVYSSSQYSNDHGVLRILARRGLVVKEEDAHGAGGGNVIDFPALEWLVKQEEPRVWVSDGCVTGKGERTSFSNRAQCFDLCKRKGVLRTPHVPQAIQLFHAIRLRRAGIKSAAAGYKLDEHAVTRVGW